MSKISQGLAWPVNTLRTFFSQHHVQKIFFTNVKSQKKQVIWCWKLAFPYKIRVTTYFVAHLTPALLLISSCLHIWVYVHVECGYIHVCTCAPKHLCMVGEHGVCTDECVCRGQRLTVGIFCSGSLSTYYFRQSLTGPQALQFS